MALTDTGIAAEVALRNLMTSNASLEELASDVDQHTRRDDLQMSAERACAEQGIPFRRLQPTSDMPLSADD